MRSRVLLYTVAFLLRSLFKSHAALVLAVIIIILPLFAIGIRTFVFPEGQSAVEDVQVLVEKPSLERVRFWASLFLLSSPAPTERTRPDILFSNVTTLYDMSATALDAVLLFAFPFAAILIGIGFSPCDDSPSATILAAPLGRSVLFFGHAIATLVYVVAVSAAALVASGLLVLILIPSPQTMLIQLARCFLSSTLYSAAFVSMGLCVGVIFRKRPPAFMAGIVLVIVLIGITPNLRELIERTYTSSHREEIMQAAQQGREPDDATWMIIKAIRQTPASALGIILREINAPTTVQPDCATCQAAESSRRIVARAQSALGAAVLVPLALGWLVYVRKELSYP